MSPEKIIADIEAISIKQYGRVDKDFVIRTLANMIAMQAGTVSTGYVRAGAAAKAVGADKPKGNG